MNLTHISKFISKEKHISKLLIEPKFINFFFYEKI